MHTIHRRHRRRPDEHPRRVGHMDAGPPAPDSGVDKGLAPSPSSGSDDDVDVLRRRGDVPQRHPRWADIVEPIAREFRFLSGLVRTLWNVRKVHPNSNELICDDFEYAVDKFGDKIALVFENERYTYRQLDALANRFAAWADTQGIERGAVVAILLPNCAE